MTSMELWCHMASSAWTHLTRVRPRELLCSESGAVGPNGHRNLEEMFKEKLKHILSLLRLGASVDVFLGVWTSSVHLLVGQVTICIS
jgi:hypothetical protein